jgi:hypothetical protein
VVAARRRYWRFEATRRVEGEEVTVRIVFELSDIADWEGLGVLGETFQVVV